MLHYLATLSLNRTILWCYLCWYVTIVSFHFEASIALWLSSLGMSVIIGTALLLSTSSSSYRPPGWATFRLFLMPFCVSSYSALIVGKGFFLIFPPSWRENGIGFGTCAAFLFLRFALSRHGASRQIHPPL